MKIQLCQAILFTIVGFLIYDHIVSCFTNETSIISYYILRRVKRNRQKKLIKGENKKTMELILNYMNKHKRASFGMICDDLNLDSLLAEAALLELIELGLIGIGGEKENEGKND